MNKELSEELIDLIKNNEWVIFSTADLNNNPRAIVVIPSRIEKDRIILSNIQMNKSIENMQIKISGIADVYEDGNLYTEIKKFEETNNLPDDLKVNSIIVIEYENIEITQE